MLNSRVTFELLGVFVKQPSSDNTPYEKIGDEVRSLADEVPFNIPDSWEWVRLGTVIQLQSGQDMTPDRYNDCGKGIPYITGASNIENGSVLINRWTEYGRAFAYCGDILLTCKGTVGTMAVLQETQVHIARQIMAIRPISELYIPYIQIVLDTLVENLKAAAKSMIPGIAREDVLQSLFPVPPVSEQKRIVQKITDLSPCLSQYAAADTKLFSLNAFFPETLKKSILQEAVQGKLVPQDPSDEPAEALLGRIRAEKQRLIKEGKIKKDKHESVIFRRDNSHYEKLDGVERCIDDALPFEIPENWRWCRLGTLVAVLGGKRISAGRKLTSDNTGHVYIRVSDMKDGGVNTDNLLYVPEDIYPSISKYIISSADVFITVAGTIGRVGKIPAELDGSNLTENADRLVFTIIDQDWLILLLQSSLIQEQIIEATTKVGQPKLAIARIERLLVALPPVKEQHRIVQRIEELLPLVKGL